MNVLAHSLWVYASSLYPLGFIMLMGVSLMMRGDSPIYHTYHISKKRVWVCGDCTIMSDIHENMMHTMCESE